MSLDFARIKEIKLIDVLARYKVPLRFKGDYAACACPLPTHKHGDTAKSFSVHLKGNYFRCFSETCNHAAGKKGGDVINFVALMEGATQLDAARKLATWYGIAEKENAPQRMAEGTKEKPKAQMQSSNQNSTASPATVKDVPVKGYMGDVDAWFDELFRRGEKETDVDFWKRTRNGVKAKLVESFRNGKRVSSGLQPQSE